jgi:predicted anti-sigma-YlaC factor YlaD
MVHLGELIPAYLEGEPMGEKKERLEEHLVVCPRCRDELAALEEVDSLLSEAPLLSPQPGFTAQVMARLAQREARRRLMRIAPALVAVSFMLTSLVLLSLVGLLTPWWGSLAAPATLINLGFDLLLRFMQTSITLAQAFSFLLSAILGVLPPGLLLSYSFLMLGLMMVWARLVARAPLALKN